MGIYIRQGSAQWWLTIVDPKTGVRFRKSCQTTDRKLAQRVYEQLQASLLLGVPHRLTETREYRTWNEATERWLRETSYKKDHGADKRKIEWLKPHFGGQPLAGITVAKIRTVLEIRAAQTSYSTANRLRSLIRAILNRAATEWDWLDKVPFIRPYKVVSTRIRFLTKTEAQKLLNELPVHLADMMTFALSTGLRSSNVTQLKWSQIDLEKGHLWIHADEAKAGKDIGIPLNKTAIDVLKRQQGKNDVFVFTFRGQPVTRPSNHAWLKALKRAEISNFRWHDLRHTWASWHIQAGTPLNILQELGGWHSYTMVQRYAHLTSKHLARFTKNAELT